ncbi:MCD, Malonyl-CoA decarboxylase MCD [Afipia sp. P52-10]|uniref:malonyl-CoA decarboxylase n=1 Tax=Afipia sp. P52-10 TaxID=1429916 RepID=UPI0003DF1A53|nr:malonyl-CoA decarboxylase [Afipia sp. P52-10]ETR78005.1 MCD, Malonyl-CoA decarboxylase MCD [Afipia sp. P52-10]
MTRPRSQARGFERAPAFLSELLNTLTERGRALLGGRFGTAGVAPMSQTELIELGEALLSRRGEATGVALAQTLLAGYTSAATPDRIAFLKALADRFGPERERIEQAIAHLQASDFDAGAVKAVHDAAEPRRQELFRRLNLAPGGTAALLRMREALLANASDNPQFKLVDSDFVHLFASWFNRGFLVLRRIDWTTPANILEKIIRYEAVHAIENWDDLRNRLAPADRRCYGFFHPQLVDEPLIFVEVALTKDIPGAIAPLLDLARTPIAATEATTAVFYSISNTQKGLGGISFGNFLIKQVVEELKRELPNLQTFVTLSPVPEFANWLAGERAAETPAFLNTAAKETLKLLDQPGWQDNAEAAEKLQAVLLPAAAYYFLQARNARGRQIDPVARFHLGNGARLERLDFLGDRSLKGLQQSHGLMVNYLYALDEIEANHEAFAEKGSVAAAPAIRKLLRTGLPSTETAPAA